MVTVHVNAMAFINTVVLNFSDSTPQMINWYINDIDFKEINALKLFPRYT